MASSRSTSRFARAMGLAASGNGSAQISQGSTLTSCPRPAVKPVMRAMVLPGSIRCVPDQMKSALCAAAG